MSAGVIAPPGEDLRQNLLRLGPDGERADRFLCEAARQLTRRGEMQGEVVAYLLREALGALLKLGGEKPFDLKQSAQRVVTASKLPEEDGGSRSDLERSSVNLSRPWETPTRRVSKTPSGSSAGGSHSEVTPISSMPIWIDWRRPTMDFTTGSVASVPSTSMRERSKWSVHSSGRSFRA
jgi:hypothetical protein